MGTTIKTVLWTKKPRKDGSLTIKVRVTINRKAMYISLPYSVPKKFWNERNCRVRLDHPNSERINNEIEKMELELNNTYQAAKITNPVVAVRTKQKEMFKLLSFMDYLEEHINLLNLQYKFGTCKKYVTVRNILTKFLKSKKKDLYFHEITLPFLQSLEIYLLNDGVRINGVKTYFKGIRKLYFQAIKQELFKPIKNPFIHFKLSDQEEVELRSLKEKELKAIINVDLKPGDELFHTKNQFLFQIAAYGMRVSDLNLLRWRHFSTDCIKYTMHKTKIPIEVNYNDNMLMLLRYYTGEVYTEYESMRVYCHNNNLKLDEGESLKWAVVQREFFDSIKNDMVRLSLDPKTRDNFIFPMLKNYEIRKKFTHLTKEEIKIIESRNVVYNRRLKRLAKMAGLNIPISTHYCRHTFSHLLVEMNFDVYDISKSLGHTALATTERYVDRFNKSRTKRVGVAMDDFVKF